MEWIPQLFHQMRNELIIAAVCLLGAKILSFFEPYALWVIKQLAAKVEKKYADEMKSGKKKKCIVLKILRFIFLGMNKKAPLIIDALIAEANKKGGEMTAAIKSVTLTEVKSQIASFTSKK